jgi:hypothetical protein
MTKCVWSNKKSDELEKIVYKRNKFIDKIYFVLPENKNKLQRYLKRAESNDSFFMIFMLVFIFFVSIASIAPSIALYSLYLLSVFLFFYPFATDLTIKLIGIKNSIYLARFLSLILFSFTTKLLFLT